jgi:hypothetical protein
MDSSKFQFLGVPLTDNKDLLSMYETFKEIEDVYNKSLAAMGIQPYMNPAISGSTNITLSNTNHDSTRS